MSRIASWGWKPWAILAGYIAHITCMFCGESGRIVGLFISTPAFVLLILYSVRKQTIKNDSQYYYPTLEELNKASDYANVAMAMTGWKLTDYVSRWKDCDDFAERKATLMKEWFYATSGIKEGFGLGIAPFGYTKENGKGHVCVECLTDKGRAYYECYPGFGELKLTNKELKSAGWINF